MSNNNKIPAKVRQKVWNTYIGELIGKILCPLCQITFITCFEFCCAHVLANHHGGTNSIDNLRAICSLCNLSMGTHNMIDFIKAHFPTSPLIHTFPTYLFPIVPVALAHTQTVPQTVPQIVPQTVPQIVPQTVPQIVPQTVPQIVSLPCKWKCGKVFAHRSGRSRHESKRCQLKPSLVVTEAQHINNNVDKVADSSNIRELMMSQFKKLHNNIKELEKSIDAQKH
jgi:hypothetical protein